MGDVKDMRNMPIQIHADVEGLPKCDRTRRYRWPITKKLEEVTCVWCLQQTGDEE